jgi:hypothetical protein
MFLTCFSTVLGDEEAFGDRVVGASLGDQGEHLALAIGEALERVVALTAPADELADDRGVQDRASVPDAVDAGGELVEVGYALLEQVPDAVGPGGEQLERVAGVDVLGEDQDSDRRPSLADDLGSAQSFVGVRRWHPDVDDRHVRLGALHQLEQSLAVGSEPHDLESGFREKAGEAFTEDHGVVGHRYAHGISARSVVP